MDIRQQPSAHRPRVARWSVLATLVFAAVLMALISPQTNVSYARTIQAPRTTHNAGQAQLKLLLNAPAAAPAQSVAWEWHGIEYTPTITTDPTQSVAWEWHGIEYTPTITTDPTQSVAWEWHGVEKTTSLDATPATVAWEWHGVEKTTSLDATPATVAWEWHGVEAQPAAGLAA